MFLSVTNSVNFVSIDAEFLSATGAEGLLTVYWDTNTIGSIDERVIRSGIKSYSLGFPRTTDNSSHTLGFRLDPFTNIQSSINITNVVLGSVGVSRPFTLSTTSTPDGFRMLQLAGQAGFKYTIESSTNLSDWTPFAILVNTNGIVRFIDSTSTNATIRFYRAVAQ